MAPRWECGVCWYVYEPEAGDDVWQVPPGTAFEDLPSHWRCPRCDAAKERFMRQKGDAGASPAPVKPAALGLEEFVTHLERAYQEIGRTRMQGLPFLNPKLTVEAVGFRSFEGGLFGALVTPWSINAIVYAPNDSVAPALGRARELPSGRYTFFPQALPGLTGVELASIFSPAQELEGQDAAVVAAMAAVEAMLASPEAAAPEPQPGEQTKAPSRRAMLFPFLSR